MKNFPLSPKFLTIFNATCTIPCPILEWSFMPIQTTYSKPEHLASCSTSNGRTGNRNNQPSRARNVALVSASELSTFVETALCFARQKTQNCSNLHRALLKPKNLNLGKVNGSLTWRKRKNKPQRDHFSSRIPRRFALLGGKQRKILLRAFDLIEAILRETFTGVGKPEPLKYLASGVWSRRLHSTRIVYLVSETRIDFCSALSLQIYSSRVWN